MSSTAPVNWKKGTASTLARHLCVCTRLGGGDYNGEGGCLSGLFVPHSNSVKPQLKWGVTEIRKVGVFEKSVVCRGFSLCVFCTVSYLCAHVSSCIFHHFEKHSENIFIKWGQFENPSVTCRGGWGLGSLRSYTNHNKILALQLYVII